MSIGEHGSATLRMHCNMKQQLWIEATKHVISPTYGAQRFSLGRIIDAEGCKLASGTLAIPLGFEELFDIRRLRG